MDNQTVGATNYSSDNDCSSNPCGYLDIDLSGADRRARLTAELPTSARPAATQTRRMTGPPEGAGSRAMAEAVCRFCDRPIGYDARLYNDDGYVHAPCLEDSIEAARLGGE